MEDFILGILVRMSLQIEVGVVIFAILIVVRETLKYSQVKNRLEKLVRNSNAFSFSDPNYFLFDYTFALLISKLFYMRLGGDECVIRK